MQTRKIQLQPPQLELFHPQPELISWHELPHETQQKAKTLLVKLLREHARTWLPCPGVKAGNHE
ncbi:MAG: hypothetical protein ACJ746_31335 [Bryobacteraceae bacterium]